MTAEEIWEEVEALNGLSLRTIERGLPFKVVAVTSTHIVLAPESSGREKSISRNAIQQAFDELFRRRELSGSDISVTVGESQSSYVVTILATLPNVAVCRKPIRLIYNGWQLFYLQR
jgi:hypothetical protein